MCGRNFSEVFSDGVQRTRKNVVPIIVTSVLTAVLVKVCGLGVALGAAVAGGYAYVKGYRVKIMKGDG